MVKWILLGLVALPIVEIAVFILVAASIGLVWALAITLATTALGLLVLRLAGQGWVALIRRASSGGMSGIEAGIEANPNGLLLVLGGILLVLPGFITDAVGALLLIAPLRHWMGLTFQRRAGTRRAPDGVVDLGSEEWKEVPNREIENRQGGSNGR